MDLVVVGGKSVKNTDVYILFTPDSKSAIDMLIRKRDAVGVPKTNPYVFARLHSNSPLSGNVELSDIARSCPGLKYPERITSTALRKYVATVSQVRQLEILLCLSVSLGYQIF